MQGNIIPGVTEGTPTRNLQSADTSWFAPVALAQSQSGNLRHDPTSPTGVNLDPLLTPCQQKTPWEFSQGVKVSRLGNLHPVLEDAMEQKPTTVSAGVRPLEIDQHRVHPVDLLIGVGAAVTHGDDQDEQFRVLLSDLGEDLDEVEGPVAPGMLLGVREPVVPCLELIQNEHGRLLLEHVEQNFLSWKLGFLITEVLPQRPSDRSLRVSLEKDVPEELVIVQVDAHGDDEAVRAQGERADLGAVESGTPFIEPGATLLCIRA